MANIAFDATANGNGNTNSLTYAHTCTGSDRVLFVGVADNAGGAWNITGATYNGVAMTEIAHTANANGNFSGLFYLINPATGSNNVVISSSHVDFIFSVSASYTGVSQASQPDASSSNLTGGATSLSATVTVPTQQDWVVSFIGNSNASAMTGSTGVNSVRGSNSNVASLGDSNGTVATGNQSHTWTFSSQGAGMIIAAIKSQFVTAQGGFLLNFV